MEESFFRDKINEYLEKSDELLIEQLRAGEEAVMEFLMDKYKNLVKSKAKSMFILGADTEDLIQEGMIGLFKAVRDYDPGRDASFSTFASLCISRQMYTAVQASNRQKHKPLNSYISLYSMRENNECNGINEEFINVLENVNVKNPEQLLIDKENVLSLEMIIEEELSDFEKQVLDLYITGMSYSEIAKVLGRNERATDNALQRIKTKIRKAIAL